MEPESEQRSRDHEGWNLVVTAQQGTQRRLRRALAPLIRLQRSGFRNVLLGRIDDPDAFLAALGELHAARPALAHWLGKAIALERTFPVDPLTFAADVQREASHFVDRLLGRSFHVRVVRRGHKGEIDSHACEQALGAFLGAECEARGAQPVVTFEDPDVILTVEVVGDTAGLALVTRDLRARHPFVHVD